MLERMLYAIQLVYLNVSIKMENRYAAVHQKILAVRHIKGIDQKRTPRKMAGKHKET